MIKISRVSLALAAAMLAAGVARSGAAQAPDEGMFASAGELKAKVAKTTDGLAIAPTPTGQGDTVLVVRRTKAGEVEVHEHFNDELMAQVGHASVRVGGKVSGNRATTPGEWRGGTIAGGHVYQLAPGDVLWIPAGAPHQVAPKGGSFSYLAVKFPSKPAAK